MDTTASTEASRDFEMDGGKVAGTKHCRDTRRPFRGRKLTRS